MKKNKTATTIVLTTFFCLLPILFGLAMYDKLPDKIPSHFNFAGEVDGYSSKAFGVFGLPLIMAAANLLVAFALNTDPKRSNYSKAIKILSLCLVPFISIALSLFIYIKALGGNLPITPLIMGFLAVIYLVFGYYMPQIKRNYTMGIKLPWTMDNDENWDKTHKFAGKLWLIAGLVLLANILIKSLPLMLIVILISSIAPMLYSYLFYRKNKNSPD